MKTHKELGIGITSLKLKSNHIASVVPLLYHINDSSLVNIYT